MAVRLYVCGTRGSFPTFGKKYETYGQATTCYVIKEDDYAIVLDCGTGMINAAEVLKDCTRVDVILSHVHYDHLMGLFVIQDPCPGAELTFYGNFDAWTAVSNKEGKGGSHTFWPDIIKKSPQVSVKPGEKYTFANGFEVEFAPSTHGDGAFMTKISKSGRKLVFTGDYEQMPGNGIEDWVRNCDLVIYDGSYAPEEYPGHEGWGHSTWKQATDLALKCNIRQLLITHYANTHDDASLKAEEIRARQHMKHVTFAREGVWYPLIDAGDVPDLFQVTEENKQPAEPEKPAPVCVRARVREEELKRIAHIGWLRRRCYITAAVNWLICFLSILGVYGIGRRGVQGAMASCPAILLLLIAGISFLMSIFDLNSVDKKEGSFLGRPHWANIALLLESASAIALFLSSVVFWVPVMGFATYSTNGFPGGTLVAVVIPALILYDCSFLEAKAKISVADLAIVLAALLGVHLIAWLVGPSFGLSGILYESYCEAPGSILYSFLYMGATLLCYFINGRLLKRGIGYHRPVKEKPKRILFRTEREFQILYMVLNGLILVFSARHVLITLVTDSVSWFANPVLLSMVLIPISVISIVFNVRAYINNSVGIYPVWYKYIAYTRALASFLNFTTLLAAVYTNGKGLAGLISVYWYGDFTIYLLCPVIAGFLLFSESHEYDYNSMIYADITVLVMLFGSRLGISIKGIESKIPMEMETYYSGGTFLFIILFEVLMAVLIFIADRIYVDNARFEAGEVRVKRSPDGKVELLIAGARGGVAPTKASYYGYGQASNCAILRDGSYGMILDCGSGLIYAPEFLKGCTDVDVFLSDTRFSTVMGLLAAPNPCPGAKIRIFGPFGRGTNFENMNGFATPPLWPVNVIVGECISATPDKDIRLNDLYSVRFQLVPRESGHYILRVSGAVGVCYTGPLDFQIKEEDEWAKDCDILICDGHRGPEEAVALSKRCGVGYVLVGNHPSFADDTALAAEEAKGKAEMDNLSYARQGTVYTIM